MKDNMVEQSYIEAFIHCKLCLDELNKGDNYSPEEYAWLSCGWTKKGIQLWCARHECNILHIDFEGMKHPADVTRNVRF